MGKTFSRLSAILLIVFASIGLNAQKVGMVEDVNTPTVAEFLQKNSAIDSIQWKDRRYMTLYLRLGKKETYDMDSQEVSRNFFKKYGSPSLPPSSPNSRISRRRLN